MQVEVPLRIHLPLLPSWVMTPLLFSLLWESERLSLLSSDPSSDSSFATSEMSFFINKKEWRIYYLYIIDTDKQEPCTDPKLSNIFHAILNYILYINLTIFGYYDADQDPFCYVKETDKCSHLNEWFWSIFHTTDLMLIGLIRHSCAKLCGIPLTFNV